MNHDDVTKINKNRVRWKCRRGMLELDQTLAYFFDEQYDQLTEKEKKDFNDLLTLPDPILWDWLSGRSQPGTTRHFNLVKKIHEHKKCTSTSVN